MLPEAEVIKTAEEIFEGFLPYISGGFSIQINHIELLNYIYSLTGLNVNEKDMLHGILMQLSSLQFTQVREKYEKELNAEVWGLLESFYIRGNTNNFGNFEADLKTVWKLIDSRCNSALPSKLSAAFEELQELIDLLHTIGIRRQIFVNPLLSYNHRYYCSVIFQFVQHNQARDVLAAGGR